MSDEQPIANLLGAAHAEPRSASEWRDIDESHAAFGARLLDVLRVLVGRLATNAPMNAEALRTAFRDLIPDDAPPGAIEYMPLRRLVEDLDNIIDIRDRARFDKTADLARAAGRMASDGGTA